jgi:hypothetical protein
MLLNNWFCESLNLSVLGIYANANSKQIVISEEIVLIFTSIIIFLGLNKSHHSLVRNCLVVLYNT